VTIERYRAEQNQTSLEDKGRKKEDDCIRPHQLKSTRPSRTELVREIRKQKGRWPLISPTYSPPPFPDVLCNISLTLYPPDSKLERGRGDDHWSVLPTPPPPFPDVLCNISITLYPPGSKLERGGGGDQSYLLPPSIPRRFVQHIPHTLSPRLQAREGRGGGDLQSLKQIHNPTTNPIRL